MMLPYVIQFNKPVASNSYIRIVNQIFEGGGPSEPKKATLNLASSLKRFFVNLGFPENLKRAGVSESMRLRGSGIPTFRLFFLPIAE